MKRAVYVSLLALGCSTDPRHAEIEVHDARLLAATEEAAVYWQNAEHDIDFRIVRSCGESLACYRLYVGTFDGKADTRRITDDDGWYHTKTVVDERTLSLDGLTLTGIVAHELGHSLGLEHTCEAGACDEREVMVWNSDADPWHTCIGPATREQYRKKYGTKGAEVCW